jgi:hypothetical protein
MHVHIYLIQCMSHNIYMFLYENVMHHNYQIYFTLIYVIHMSQFLLTGEWMNIYQRNATIGLTKPSNYEFM